MTGGLSTPAGARTASSFPVGPLFCIIDGPTRGRAWPATAVRGELRTLAAQAGVRRRFAPHQLRHAHAVELAREGVPVNIIQRQLGHTRPRHHQHLLAGDRPERDRQRRALPPTADDARQRRTRPLNAWGVRAGGRVSRARRPRGLEDRWLLSRQRPRAATRSDDRCSGKAATSPYRPAAADVVRRYQSRSRPTAWRPSAPCHRVGGMRSRKLGRHAGVRSRAFAAMRLPWQPATRQQATACFDLRSKQSV